MISDTDRLFQILRRKMSMWFVIFFLLSVSISVDTVRTTTEIAFFSLKFE